MWRFSQPIFATLVLLFSFFCSIGQSASVIIEEETGRVDLHKSLLVLEDDSFSPSEAFSKISNGKLLEDAIDLNPKKVYWLYVNVNSRSNASKNMVLGLGKVDKGTLHYRVTGETDWEVLKSGWLFPKPEKQEVQGEIEHVQFEIEFEPNQSYELLVKLENPTYAKLKLAPVLNDKAVWKNDFLGERAISNVVIGVVLGFLGIMFFYNLLVFFFSKEKIYAYYALYILTAFIYAINLSGFFLDRCFGDYPVVYLLIRGVVPNIGLFAYVLFAQTFIGTKEAVPRGHKFYNVVKVWMILNIVLIVFAIPFTLNQLFLRQIPAFGHLVAQLSLVVFAIQLFTCRRKLFSYFAVGTLIFGICAAVTGFVAFSQIYPMLVGLSVGFTGLAGEMIAFSLGLGYKIRLAEEEKRAAQEETANLLKTQNETLEKKVKERTEEITTQNEELHQQQEEIVAQRDYIESQNKDLRYKNDQITDSIRYAQTIQEAILPFEERFDNIFTDHFIFYRPKDIVSGDFYWLDTIGNTKLIAVLDCTGHGVPGGFMSMVGFSILNDIVLKERETSPAEILEKLNESLVRILKQEDSQAINRDGMDVGLCAIHEGAESNKVKVVYCGAKRPLYYVEPSVGELKEVKGDRKTIGGYQPKDKRFGDKVLTLEKGSILYLTTDGFADQNNSKGKKFGSPALRQLLGEISSKSLEEQHTSLSKVFDMHSDGQPQRDDVAVIGIKI